MGTLSCYCITLTFAVRLRRNDLIPLTNTFHRRRSRAAPNAITEYRPRETNVISDYLAGQASAWIRNNQHDPRCSGEPFSLPVDPPYDLLLEANAVILGPHVAGKVVLILQETLGCNQSQLAACLRVEQWKPCGCYSQPRFGHSQCYYITDSRVHYTSQ